MSGIGLPSSGRALMILTPATRDDTHQPHRSQPLRPANFLTQLIANASRLPQTRDRRRAEPAEGIAAYRAAIAMMR